MNTNQNLKKINIKIHGMHCASCEVLIERKFKTVSGVEDVNVSHVSGKAELYCSAQPQMHELQNAVKADGYSVSPWDKGKASRIETVQRNTKQDYLEIGMIFLLVMALYLIFSSLDLLPKGLTVTGNMSYGLIFLIGLVAASSTCIAVTGGLLLAVAAKYNERHPDVSGSQKFKPHLYFNLGRIISYTLLGGAIGALGSVFNISSRASGFITIAASLVMILLGFQLLKLFPGLRRFQPRMPKFLAHRIHEAGSGQTKTAPLAFGAATFFLPCGFTQALQLYVLSRGSFATGALTMLAFSLGTLPALLSLSAISSFAKGAFQGYFLKFSGVVVILLGLFNINNGITLAGGNFSLASLFQTSGLAVAAEEVKVVDGKQVVNMKVVGLNYIPYQFRVKQGLPVEWRIDGSQAQGCAQVITVPKLGITEYLPPQGLKIIAFTPQEPGTITFSCSMGMTTRGAAFIVEANGQSGITGVQQKVTEASAPAPSGCDTTGSCQRLSMVVSAEQGFYPRSFTAKKGLPVELIVDDQVPLGGCMSVMLIPKYNVAKQMAIGQNKLSFTPTQSGTVPITCSMGVKIAQIEVTD